ncbi:biopolymer transporter ExbD [Gilvimarinus agarilyticus]|uniref:ExbD/TolR family protein n=1 Tax=unclassified Gilvimarinus TaxID=2642066 RepID=UPI001C099E4B|nr:MULTISPECIES: biopolymer transporter ExbD [unclassified Gilvimarinus]MBU2885384.1 biopolymer transporter ExbD [Gilvimarinus agarilyticus]MDO6570283.1 biopolymer transporter ExbD [Gilvimarinus sp. 2_MG-2023]MDO6746929.1 biopolymer transporter ExbD [Gilvimarinus sp. 1_MG-2023]
MSRRKKNRSSEESNDIDLTPMLDVVFIMLIFFIVTASFVKEIGLDVNVPEENDEPPPENADPNILVQITADNQIWMFGDNGLRRIDEAAVRSNIAQMRAELPKAAVIIQANHEADSGVYVAVADAARAAKAPAVVLVPVEHN